MRIRSALGRRTFLRRIGVSGSFVAAALSFGTPAVFAEGVAEDKETVKPSTLTLRHKLEVRRHIPVRAETSFLSVSAMRVSTLRGGPYISVSFRFTTREVDKVRFTIRLMDNAGGVIEVGAALVELGPETGPKRALGYVADTSWNRSIDVSVRFPETAWQASEFEVGIAESEEEAKNEEDRPS